MRKLITIAAGFALAVSLAAPAQATPAAPPAALSETVVSFVIPASGEVPSPAELEANASLAAAVILPGTKGTEFWYSAVIVGGRLYTAGNIRYSWSHMWMMKNAMSVAGGLVSAACKYIPNSAARSACGALVTLVTAGLKAAVTAAINAKKCLQLRFPMPPLVGLTTYRLVQVTCTA